ncbi:MAG TPA: hypothetical protein VF799_04350 [Geobacteraceae bacterium]
MSHTEIILMILLGEVLLALTFFVLFGETTVRKLRKNPETKNELGIEFLSGWDIINVAQALAMPRAITRKIKRSALAALFANSDLLYKHTNNFDRILAILCYWSLIIPGLFMATWALLDIAGLIG